MKRNQIFITIIIIILLFIGLKYIFPSKETQKEEQERGEEIIYHNDIIRVSNPVKNKVISSPLKIKGAARGGWYFEASFPIKLIDGNGEEVLLKLRIVKMEL